MSRRKSRAEPVEARVEALSPEGRGVAQIDGKVTFIHGALPGERVRLRYTRRYARRDEGTVLEVSLFEALAEWMGYPLYYTMGGTPPPRGSPARNRTCRRACSRRCRCSGRRSRSRR